MKYQNRISQSFLNGSDLQDREKEVLRGASEKLGFAPEKFLNKSSWWNSREIGAFRYRGKFEGKKAILKIQGMKPATSEIYMIQSFKKVNRSKILRPPLLYSCLLWDDEKRYEALVLEFIEGKPIVSTPANEKELEEIFSLRDEYKNNCTVNPWIKKPKESLSEEIKINFEKWRQASFKLYSKHPFRKNEDQGLIYKAVEILIKNYRNIDREFQHGHFGISDLLKTKNGQVIILANLYWSWKPPFYDAVFGYHWFIYNLAKLKNVSTELIEQQGNLWLAKINNLAKTDMDKKLLALAFLERAAAGLNLDALSVDQKSPVAEYLVEETRRNLSELTEKCRSIPYV